MTSRVHIRRYMHLGWLGLVTMSAGCVVSTGMQVNDVDLQSLLANSASPAVVEQKLGPPYAKHFVSGDSEVWTYLHYGSAGKAPRCGEITGTVFCTKWIVPIDQAVLSFQNGRLNDAVLLKREGAF